VSEQFAVPAPVGALRRELRVAVRRAQEGIPGCVAFVGTLLLGASNGGYFPAAWGWAALASLWIAGIALLVRSEISLGQREVVFLAGLTAFGLFVALGAAWSPTSKALYEAERMVVYVAGLTALLVVTRRKSYAQILAGALVGITLVSGYGLATRLFPERLSTYDPVAIYRLSEPLGYWNALGIFAVIGVLLALGFATRAQAVGWRALAASSIVLLLSTIYFTYGRGPVAALGIGLIALVAFDPRRLLVVTTMIVVGLPAGIAIWLGSRYEALGRQSSSIADASREGHRFALLVLVLMAVAAVAMLASVAVERRVQIPRSVRQAYAAALLLAIVLSLGAVFVGSGSPPTLIHKAYRSFKAPPVDVSRPGSNLSKRFLSLSSNGRLDMWTAARRDYEQHPWFGSGAGSYEQYWLQHRPAPVTVRDAHSLYLETLAEYGPLGLGLLLVTLCFPLIAAVKARRRRLVPAAFAVYVAFLFHAGIDWDWEMPAVTLAGLGCGAAILVAARGQERVWRLSSRARMAAVLATIPLATFALVGLIGNSALAESHRAVRAGEWNRAESQARKAIRWIPWSSEGWSELAEAQLGTGDVASARTSYAKALKKDPKDGILWFDYGLLNTGTERNRAINKARELNPLNVGVQSIVGTLAKTTKDGSLPGKK
jgi:hypothetical protein